MPGAALPIALALSMAAHAAADVAPDTVVTFAQQESGLRPLAIHDNDTGRSYDPSSLDEAKGIASTLILRLGHSTDVGVMQVNSKNFGHYGLTIDAALDPRHSMHTGAAILRDAWLQCPDRPPVLRLRCAAQVYNSGSTTGSPLYGARIFRTAAQLVPSITEMLADFPNAAPEGATDARRTITTHGVTAPSLDEIDASKPTCAAPHYDVWGQAACKNPEGVSDHD